MKILAFEFSSAQRSVAVLHLAADGQALASSEVIESAPGHTMKPFSMIEQALAEAKLEREQIECLALGLGPGSYTGIRAGIALAQGWQLGRAVKLLGVSTAECLAHQAQGEGLNGPVVVVIDAQRGEFYLGDYEISADEVRERAPLRIVAPAEIIVLAEAGVPVSGPGITKWFPQGRDVFPRAAMVARLAAGRTDFVAGEAIEPIYLRETSFVKAPPSRVLPPM